MLANAAVGPAITAAAVAMLFAVWHIGLPWRYLHLALVLSALLFVFTIASVIRRSPKLNFGLYKLASLYMLGSMLLIMLGVLLNAGSAGGFLPASTFSTGVRACTL